jgi:hypothetical protein
MYAAVMHLKFEPDLAAAAASAFTEHLLPKVKAARGFRNGYWLEPSEGKGLGLILFDDEDQARSASGPEQWQAPGVTVEFVDVRRVAATA